MAARNLAWSTRYASKIRMPMLGLLSLILGFMEARRQPDWRRNGYLLHAAQKIAVEQHR